MSRRRGGKKRGGVWGVWGVRLVLLIGCVGMVLNLMFFAERWQNGIAMYGIHWARAVDDGKVRVMHWNLSAGEIDVGRTVAWIQESNVDVALIANPRWNEQRQELVDGLEGIVDEGGTVRRLPRAVVMSRFELLSVSMVSLNAHDAEGDSLRATGGFGWVSLLKFDGGEEHGVFDVWFVDLPSEPTVHRMESMGEVVELLRGSKGGLRPALVVGDFNTVRGSASLGLFDEFEDGDGFVDAFEERGAFGGSWRPNGLTGLRGWIATRSSWHIDLSLVGNGWGVHGYELVMPDGSSWGEGVSHRAQVVDIELMKE